MRLPQVSFSMAILEAVTSVGGMVNSAPRFHTLVIGLHVVGEEHGRGLALLEHRLLVGFGRRVVVGRQLQLRAVRVLW
jgi:hypothetical protein